MPGRMAQRTAEMSPADINWPALNHTRRKQRGARLVIFVALVRPVGVRLRSSSPSSPVFLSRVSTLAGSTSWLHWVGTLPRWLVILHPGHPPSGHPCHRLEWPDTDRPPCDDEQHKRSATTGSQGERSLQLWYFIFLLVFELFRHSDHLLRADQHCAGADSTTRRPSQKSWPRICRPQRTTTSHSWSLQALSISCQLDLADNPPAQLLRLLEAPTALTASSTS